MDLSSAIRVKRVYEQVEADDGWRILVDHIWPRGVSKERAQLSEWARELAPSDSLRRWFGHDPERFEEFQQRYRQELSGRSEEVERLCGRAQDGRVTVLYAARDEEHNNGLVVARLLNEQLGEAGGAGA